MKTQMNRIAKIALSMTVLASFASCGAKKAQSTSDVQGVRLPSGARIACSADFGTISTGQYIGEMRVAISIDDNDYGGSGSVTIKTEGRAVENNIAINSRQYSQLVNGGQTMLAQRLVSPGIVVTDQISYRNNTVTVITGLGNQFNVPCTTPIGY
jgi:hypothetical protein